MDAYLKVKSQVFYYYNLTSEIRLVALGFCNMGEAWKSTLKLSLVPRPNFSSVPCSLVKKQGSGHLNYKA